MGFSGEYIHLKVALTVICAYVILIYSINEFFMFSFIFPSGYARTPHTVFEAVRVGEREVSKIATIATSNSGHVGEITDLTGRRLATKKGLRSTDEAMVWLQQHNLLQSCMLVNVT